MSAHIPAFRCVRNSKIIGVENLSLTKIHSNRDVSTKDVSRFLAVFFGKRVAR